MSKMLRQALMMGAIMGVSDNINYGNSKRSLESIDLTPKTPPVPKGAKKYFFDRYGYHAFGKSLLGSECVFNCIAINDNSAVKKYNKWKANQKAVATKTF